MGTYGSRYPVKNHVFGLIDQADHASQGNTGRNDASSPITSTRTTIQASNVHHNARSIGVCASSIDEETTAPRRHRKIAATHATTPIATNHGHARANACAMSADADPRAHPAATNTPMIQPAPIADGISEARRV